MILVIGIGVVGDLPVRSASTWPLTTVHAQAGICCQRRCKAHNIRTASMHPCMLSLCAKARSWKGRAAAYISPSLSGRLGRRSLISRGSFALTPCNLPFVRFFIVTLGLDFLERRREPPMLASRAQVGSVTVTSRFDGYGIGAIAVRRHRSRESM